VAAEQYTQVQLSASTEHRMLLAQPVISTTRSTISSHYWRYPAQLYVTFGFCASMLTMVAWMFCFCRCAGVTVQIVVVVADRAKTCRLIRGIVQVGEFKRTMTRFVDRESASMRVGWGTLDNGHHCVWVGRGVTAVRGVTASVHVYKPGQASTMGCGYKTAKGILQVGGSVRLCFGGEWRLCWGGWAS
jgi:hypothetical protein